MDSKNEKSVSELAKLPSLRPLEWKREFLLEFKFLKNYKDLYGKCRWWARSAHKSFKFPKNSSSQKNSLCNVRSFKLCHFHIFDMLFSFLGSVLFHDRFWWLTRSRDRVMQRAYSCFNFLVSAFFFAYNAPKVCELIHLLNPPTCNRHTIATFGTNTIFVLVALIFRPTFAPCTCKARVLSLISCILCDSRAGSSAN